MIRKCLIRMIAGLALVTSTAEAGTIQFKDASGATVSVATVTFNSAQSYLQAQMDTTGAQIDPATKQYQISTLAALGTPFQAGGSIGNTSFGISGTLPAFAATPTFNIGTAPTLTVTAASLPLPTGAATSAAQATNTAAITATQAATGSLAGTAQTVTTVLPQITATPGAAISYGTTAAILFTSNTARHFMTIQVQGAPDTTGTNGCYINGIASATADANSLFIARGGYFESGTHVGTGAISIICTGTMAVYSRQG